MFFQEVQNAKLHFANNISNSSAAGGDDTFHPEKYIVFALKVQNAEEPRQEVFPKAPASPEMIPTTLKNIMFLHKVQNAKLHFANNISNSSGFAGDYLYFQQQLYYIFVQNTNNIFFNKKALTFAISGAIILYEHNI